MFWQCFDTLHNFNKTLSFSMVTGGVPYGSNKIRMDPFAKAIAKFLRGNAL